MVELPSVNNSPWRFRSWVLDLVSAVLAAFLATFAGVRLVRDPGAGRLELFGTFGTIAGIFLPNAIKAWQTRKAEVKHEPIKEPNELVGWIRGLHGQLCALKGCDAEALGVRIVIHKVHWDRRRAGPTELEQVCSYHGGVGGPLGRRISARTGIIGRVARLAEPVAAKRVAMDPESFRAELVSVWGFTPTEARDISVDRWAWFALPLLQPDDQTAYGVVYLDAKLRPFFDDGAVQDLVVGACGILASQCAALYNRP